MSGTMRLRFLLTSCLLAAPLAAGCHAPAQSLSHEAVRLTVHDDADKDALWDTTLRVLRRYRFEIDRKDRAAGVITTFPETSGHWFEFWRRDTATSYDYLEANLHTVRRSVIANLTPADTPDTYVLGVKVNAERYSAPERQVTDAAAALGVFSSAVPTTAGRLATREQVVEWIDLGRDAAMERVLLDRIVAMFGPEAYEFVAEPVEPSVNPTSP